MISEQFKIIENDSFQILLISFDRAKKKEIA